MSIIEGCIGKYRTPVPSERVCPVCGREVEVFCSMGRITDPAVCSCGYEFRREPPMVPELAQAEELHRD